MGTIEMASATAGKTLTAAARERYARDGYIIVEGLLATAETEAIHELHRRVVAAAEAKGGSYYDGAAHYDLEPLASDASGKTLALRKIQEPYQVESTFREISASGKMLDIVEDLIGSEVYYHSSKLMCKPAHGGRRKPWHQDHAYWSDMNTNQVTVWTAIDPATRKNGCIEVIPGSHKRGPIPHAQIEDWQIDESNIKNENVVIAEMKPGDVLFFNVLTLHASAANHSAKPRLSMIIDFDSQPSSRAAKSKYGSDTPLRSAKAG